MKRYYCLLGAGVLLYQGLASLAQGAEIGWEPSIQFSHTSALFSAGPASLNPDRPENTLDRIELCGTWFSKFKRRGQSRLEVDLCEGVKGWDCSGLDCRKWHESTTLTIRYIFGRRKR